LRKRKLADAADADEVNSLKAQLNSANVKILDLQGEVRRNNETDILLPQLKGTLVDFSEWIVFSVFIVHSRFR